MKPGDYVTYVPNGWRGRIKATSGDLGIAFDVVFTCAADWANHENYTGVLCHRDDLKLGWPQGKHKYYENDKPSSDGKK